VAVAVIPFILAMVGGLIVVIFWQWLSLAPPIWLALQTDSVKVFTPLIAALVESARPLSLPAIRSVL